MKLGNSSEHIIQDNSTLTLGNTDMVDIPSPYLNSPNDVNFDTPLTYTVSGIITSLGDSKVIFETGSEDIQNISCSEGVVTQYGTKIIVTDVTSTSIDITYSYDNAGTYYPKAKVGVDGYIDSAYAIQDSIEIATILLNTPTINDLVFLQPNTQLTYAVSNLNSGLTKNITLDTGSTSANTATASEGTVSILDGIITVTDVISTSVDISFEYSVEGIYNVKAQQSIPTNSNYVNSDFSSIDSIEIVSTYSVDYLIVAGGGGGGSDAGGGGGAGGYQNGTLDVGIGNDYPIVIGGGGSGYSSGARGGNGGLSSALSISSVGGGGGGGNSSANGATGGSGGGGAQKNGASAGSGTDGQGYAGKSGAAVGYGGGGGGASSTPSNATGGNGKTWLNGSCYSGGGGGGSYTEWGSLAGSGQCGGGSGANSAHASGSNASSSTGSGGGGGASGDSSGGNGGSGIVIIRYAGTSRATGGTISESGGYTYHTFTSSGTFSA
jgi:hypothetical protein